MKVFTEQVRQHIQLQEGTPIIEQLLIECYMNPEIAGWEREIVIKYLPELYVYDASVAAELPGLPEFKSSLSQTG